MTIPQALQRIIDRHDLDFAEMCEIMRTIMTGGATDAQIAALLIALRCKGESVDEITAATTVMRELSSKVPVQGDHVVDTCGTGGDGANTFNISTTCAFVAAAAGAQVAKHGNRSVSSRSGSADVLEAAGVNLDLSPEQVAQCVNEIGVGFLFAPKHHGAMRHAIGPRKEMGVRTLFNLLGPLSNPASAPNQLIGVFSEHWLNPLAQVLTKLGSQHVLLVHAEDGLDEISIAAPTRLVELSNGRISTATLAPEDFGIARQSLEALAVDSVATSLNTVMAVLQNQPGPALDIVLLNAGAAIYAANLCDSLTTGVTRAAEVIKSGAALEKLEALIAFSKAC